MQKVIKPQFKRYTFSDNNYVLVKDIIGKTIVHSIEIRTLGESSFNIRDTSSPTDFDTYNDGEIYMLHEDLKRHIKGFDISTLEVNNGSNDTIIIEFHL